MARETRSSPSGQRTITALEERLLTIPGTVSVPADTTVTIADGTVPALGAALITYNVTCVGATGGNLALVLDPDDGGPDITIDTNGFSGNETVDDVVVRELPKPGLLKLQGSPVGGNYDFSGTVFVQVLTVERAPAPLPTV